MFKKLLKGLAALLVLQTTILFAQQPQTQTAPIYAANSKYVNGVAPGYWPTPGSGFTLNISAGTAFCTSIATYAGGTLTMSPSTTNYVYLNTAASCVPAVKTSAFVTTDIPIAIVSTNGSAITSIQDTRTPFFPSGSGSLPASVVQYNPSTTAYAFAGSSIFADDSHNTSNAVTVSTWSCTPPTCTVNTTSAHNLVVGGWVQVAFMTGWFNNPPPTNFSIDDTGYGSFQVASTPSSTQFTFTYSLNTGSGSGGSIYDANYWGVYMMSVEPFFNGHGAVTYRLDSCANDLSEFTAKFGSITGSPKYLILSGCQDDIFSNPSFSSMQTTLQNLWALAHTNGWTVIQLSQLSTNYGLSATCNSGLPTGCAILTMQLNEWLPSQGKTFFNAGSGKYWDSFIDVAAYQYNWTSGGTIVGNTASGGKPFAQRMNEALANQDSSATGPPPLWHWAGGSGGPVGVMFGTSTGTYSPPLYFDDQSTIWFSVFTNGNGEDYLYVKNNGNVGPNGNIPGLAINNTSSPDLLQAIGGSSTPNFVIGRDLSNNNDAAYFGFHFVGTGSTSNYLDLGVCTSVTTSSGPLGQACGGTFTSGVHVYPNGGVSMPTVATSPSTSPICPNGTNGEFTTSGCTAGASIGGTVTYTSSQTASSADNGKLVIMNCSSACAYTLPASQPSTTWFAGVSSQGSTLATIVLGGGDTFNGLTAVPALNSFRILWVFANSATTTDYRGEAPLVQGSNVTFTPASNGLTIAATTGGSGTTVNINGGSSLGTLSITGEVPIVCSDTSGSGTAQTCTTSPSFTPQAGNCLPYNTTTQNSGASLTINVNGLGAKNVEKWLSTTTLVAGDLPANKTVNMCYNGTSWDLMTIGNPPTGGDTITSPNSTINVGGTSSATTLDVAPVAVVVDTGSTVNFSTTKPSEMHYNENATAAQAVTYNLPTAAAGKQMCAANANNGSAANTGVLTIATSATGQFIIFTDGTLSATGGNITSGGAAADSACLVGVDSTHWFLYVQSGTWTKH